MKIDATFVRSAATADDLARALSSPIVGRARGDAAAIGLVGRSNVGKSSLINALVRQRIARTSGAPGKTRLANVYRVVRPSADSGLYLVDLPGYGFARGGSEGFAEIARAFFGRVGHGPDLPDQAIAALLLVDARHPRLESDLAAWRWLEGVVEDRAIVATKVDKLARGERILALRELESVFAEPVRPVSAVTGEGLDDLWKVIDRLAKRQTNPRPSRSSRRPRPPSRGTAPRHRRS